jgi:hypothetical protein
MTDKGHGDAAIFIHFSRLRVAPSPRRLQTLPQSLNALGVTLATI